MAERRLTLSDTLSHAHGCPLLIKLLLPCPFNRPEYFLLWPGILLCPTACSPRVSLIVETQAGFLNILFDDRDIVQERRYTKRCFARVFKKRKIFFSSLFFFFLLIILENMKKENKKEIIDSFTLLLRLQLLVWKLVKEINVSLIWKAKLALN